MIVESLKKKRVSLPESKRYRKAALSKLVDAGTESDVLIKRKSRNVSGANTRVNIST